MAASGARGRSVSELSAQLQVGRPVVYRLLATLAEHDLVRRFADGHIRLGLGILPLAAATHAGLRHVAIPILRQLADATGATAHFTLADGDEAIAVAVEEPTWTDFHVGYRVGSRHPLDRGAAGKAIVDARLGKPRLARDRVVETQGELQEGARGLAVAVVGVEGLEASVGVVSLGGLHTDRAKADVLAAARTLEAALS
ncbi:MAG: helix-turn-helix domain-containing protein [Nocardioidaceae bacterium]|nr:helix-turn-helix domain-containing protein [Nocardioidaceae bacterium]